MEEVSDNKFGKKGYTVVIVILVIILGLAIYTPIHNKQIDNKCNSQASAPYTPEQYEQISNLYYQQQPTPELAFSPTEYRVIAYNSCVSSSNRWF